MRTSEIVNQWKNNEIEEGAYCSYTIDDNTNIIVEVEKECITFKFLEERFTRCETYYRDNTQETYYE